MTLIVGAIGSLVIELPMLYLLPALAMYFIGVKENSSIVCSMMPKPSTPLIYLIRKSVARAAAR